MENNYLAREIVQLEGLGNIKKSMTPLGIEIRTPNPWV
jgi:hypothetical protein